MTLKTDIKRTLTIRSERVKSIDYHESEPWLLIGLYSGEITMWNHETQQRLRLFEVTTVPVRTVKFIARKNWIVSGNDDMQIVIFNYNTLEKVHSFNAHSDYIRCLAIHPTMPYVLSCSDDLTIKLWNWDEKWTCKQVYTGHKHFVMRVAINPRDTSIFASASLDHTVKVWQISSGTANFTLEGHEKGVNCVDYYYGKDKPYLISASDDNTVRIWDYQNKSCIQVLRAHRDFVSSAHFHPVLPIIVTGSEDGNIIFWSSISYSVMNTFNYGFDRCWFIAFSGRSNNLSIGFDEGAVELKIGREEPAVSMDCTGNRIIWSVHMEIKQANLNTISDASEATDGAVISLVVKDLGICDIYPEKISYSYNGRFIAICGNGEYVIYTGMALRNKTFGNAKSLVWSSSSLEYATLEDNTIKLFNNFKESKKIDTDYGIKDIYGGYLLGVKSICGRILSFYNWENLTKIQCVEVDSLFNVFWSESNSLVCLACDNYFYILKFNQALISEQNGAELQNDCFESVAVVKEKMISAIWIEDILVYINSANQMNYIIGNVSTGITYLDKAMYLLGYIKKSNKIYLMDKEHNIISYTLLKCILDYKFAVLNGDVDRAKEILPLIPEDQKSRIAQFVEKQGHIRMAFDVTSDLEHKFDLAVKLKDMELALPLASKRNHWLQLANIAIENFDIDLAKSCLQKADDTSGLLMIGSCTGDEELLNTLTSNKKLSNANTTFITKFLLNDLNGCLDILMQQDLSLAAFFARSYLPSRITEVVEGWKSDLKTKNEKLASSIADPEKYENLFPEINLGQ